MIAMVNWSFVQIGNNYWQDDVLSRLVKGAGNFSLGSYVILTYFHLFSLQFTLSTSINSYLKTFLHIFNWVSILVRVKAGKMCGAWSDFFPFSPAIHPSPPYLQFFRVEVFRENFFTFFIYFFFLIFWIHANISVQK